MLPQQLLDQILADIQIALAKANETDPRITTPALCYTGVSTPVVACEALQVYMTRMGQDTNPESCGCGQTANVVCVLTRDCANMSNDDGTDNPPVVEEVSELMTLDGVVMSNVAMVYLDATWNIEFTVTGGLGITSMSMDLPIPC